MGIFSKKQEVGLEEFCSDFYEKNILNPIIEGIGAGDVFVDTIKRNVVEADNNFAKINSKKLANEIVPLRFELFALAWLHQFGNKVAYGYGQILHESSNNQAFVQDVFQSILPAVTQSVFTKNYLNGKSQNNIWEAMEAYNQAIARSTTIDRTPKKAFDRVYLAKVNLSRANLFDLYHKEGFDDECVARVLNRLFSEDAWKKGVTAGLLMFALCDRLGFKSNFEPTKEAQFRLTAIIRGFYDGARQALEKVKIK